MSALTDSFLAATAQIKFFADRCLAGCNEFSEAQRRFQVAPGTATMHWLVGHTAFTIDRVAFSALEIAPGLPDSYQGLFGWGTKPDGTNAGFPSWDQNVADLNTAIDRFAGEIGKRTDADFALPLPAAHPFAKMFPNRGAVVPFTAMHTTYHLGQLSLLRRAQGLPSGIGV
ncbi:MAG: DinB family protein [Gemmatimonadetes bacterium]|nr:DinB family protein [Gemmatimonadota bacterium]